MRKPLLYLAVVVSLISLAAAYAVPVPRFILGVELTQRSHFSFNRETIWSEADSLDSLTRHILIERRIATSA